MRPPHCPPAHSQTPRHPSPNGYPSQSAAAPPLLCPLPAPRLQQIRLHDFRDTGRLLALYEQAVHAQWLGPSEAERLAFVALAQHVLTYRPENAGGLFTHLVRTRCFASSRRRRRMWQQRRNDFSTAMRLLPLLTLGAEQEAEAAPRSPWLPFIQRTRQERAAARFLLSGPPSEEGRSDDNGASGSGERAAGQQAGRISRSPRREPTCARYVWHGRLSGSPQLLPGDSPARSNSPAGDSSVMSQGAGACQGSSTDAKDGLTRRSPSERKVATFRVLSHQAWTQESSRNKVGVHVDRSPTRAARVRVW
jgi:hypothetical protein